MKHFIFLILLALTMVEGGSQSADFTFNTGNGLFCSPSTVKFNEQCTGSPIGFIWNFGTQTSYENNPSISFTNPGTYTVKLTAVYEKTTATVSKSFTIYPAVNASIAYDRNYICQPGSIAFTGTASGNIATYEWDFDDQSGPVTRPSGNITHDFVNYGSYKVVLKATSTEGCSNVKSTVINVQKPTITASTSISSGCIPANVGFNATVKVPVNSTVSSYTWDFDNGTSPVSNSASSVNKTYSSTGAYYPKLSIITSEGCTNSFSFNKIAFGTPPFNLVTYPEKSVVCGSEDAVIHATATNANNYRYGFGDGTNIFSPDTLKAHRYKTLGRKYISVTPYFNGCAGNAAGLSVDVIGVIASYNYSNTCSDRKTYTFKNTSLGNITGVLWNFNDGNPNQTTLDATETFPPFGQFKTELKVVDSSTGCQDSFNKIIYTAFPKMENDDTAICRTTNTSFSLKDNYGYIYSTFTWQVVGKKIGPSVNAFVTLPANTLGNFNNYVVINIGPESCPDTVTLDHKILVKGPDLNFTAPTNVCFRTPFEVTNNSKPYIPADSIRLWYWNFGENMVNDTIYQPMPYLNKRTGGFQATLYAYDIKGCSDSLVHNYTVNRLPFLHVFNNIDTICLGQEDTLAAIHSDHIWWTPANFLSCQDCDTVIAKPTTTTKYFATATNRFNCAVQDSVTVKVYGPFNASASVNNNSICEKESVQLNVTPAIGKVTWSPAGSLSNPHIYNPVATPGQSTSYSVTLSDSVGCFSSTSSVDITVKTLPTVDAGPDMAYPYQSSFSFAPVYSTNIVNYNWTPVTSLNCRSCAVPNGIVEKTQMYSVTVVSDSGCVAKDSVLISISCNADNLLMPGAFTPNDDMLNDFYYPLTRGISLVKRFGIYNRFGQLVYEVMNFAPNIKSYGWDGKFHGQRQQQDTYVYVLDAVCDLGKLVHKQGTFLLLR